MDKKIDYSGMLEFFGVPQNMLDDLANDFNEKIASGEIDEKTVEAMLKDHERSMKAAERVAKRMQKKGIKQPEISPDYMNYDINNELKQLFDESSENAMMRGVDISFMADLDFRNLTPDDIKKMEEVNAAMQANYAVLNEEAEAANFKQKKKSKAKKMNSIELILNFDNPNITPGGSKYGGKPDVWDGFEWCVYDVEDDDEFEPEPLVFICQINLAEVSPYDKDGLLPKSGMLYFFTSPYEDDFDNGNNTFRVLYYSGDLSALKPCEYPKEYPEEFIFPNTPLTFRSVESIPDEEIGCETRHKLLGYADCIQNDMLEECEYNYRCKRGDNISWIDITEEQRIELQEASEEWTLLFQLDYLQEGDMYLMYGDGGRVYYYIRKSDLAKCDFSNYEVCVQFH